MAKITYEQVKQDIESKNWIVVSETYKNLQTDLELKCPKGHQVFMTYAKWREQKEIPECPICAKQPFVKKNESPTKKKGYRILALDQATNTSGWSLFEDGKLINYGFWTSNGNSSTQKISQVKAWMASLIDKFKVDEVIFEDIQLEKYISYGQSGDCVLTFKKLAHLQGVLKNYCYENGIQYEVIPVATWRNFSGIKGKTRTDRKKSAQLKVLDLYEIKVTEDIADAILIGRCAAARTKQPEIIMF